MRLAFHGGAGSVTGSNFLIETDGGILLIDCGMFQGQKEIRTRNYLPFAYNPTDVGAVIISHTHIDHSGRLPKLVKEGFRGPVYATPSTAELLRVLLLDSAHIQLADSNWENKKRRRRGMELIQPLYTEQDALDALRLIQPIEYHKEFRVLDNVVATFLDAGHIMGSSFVDLAITENGITRNLVGGGDLGRSHQAIIGDPEVREHADMIIIESTYGNRRHKTDDDTNAELISILQTVVKTRGTLIIPAFAVGRTQEILYRLFELSQSNSIPAMPVFVDSPMAQEVTRIYELHKDIYNEKTLEYVRMGKNPLRTPDIHFTGSLEDSMMLNSVPGPKIILSASGMCDAGRIVHHLKHNIWQKDCHILFVGFQAEGTLGRRIVDGAKKVNILGETLQVNAQIHTIGGLSAHADKEEMLAWLKFYEKSKPAVFVVHGDPAASEAFSTAIGEQLGLQSFVPQWHESANIAFTTDGIDISWRHTPVETGFREQRERWNSLRKTIDTYIDGFESEAGHADAKTVIPAEVLEKLNIALNDILEEFHLRPQGRKP
jgi:metallo-beta-lactamase family protein